MNIFYVSIRTTENYQFDKFRTAGVTGNATINRGRVTILYVQPEMKFRSTPGHFHHEPPLHSILRNFEIFGCLTLGMIY